MSTTKHLTLYDLTEEMDLALAEMEAWAAEHEGDVSDFPMNDVTAQVRLARDKKIIAVALWVKALEAEGDAIEAEEKKLAKRKKSTYARAERLRTYLENNMSPAEKIKDPRVEVFFKKNPPSVKPLIKVEEMPGEYLTRPKPEISLSKLEEDMVEIMEPVFDELGEPVFETVPIEEQDGPAANNRKQKLQAVKMVIAEIAEPVFGEDGQPKTDPETGEAIVNHVTKPIARLVQVIKLSIK